MPDGQHIPIEDAFAARGRQFQGADRRAPLRDALVAAGQYDDLQSAGRFYPMACVALEVTQRCNLDCTLCYLSENAEQAVDVPMPVLLTRIASTFEHYGKGTTIQITGGDPTLRSVADLEVLCRRIRSLGMRSCLMTNGIRATRDMLTRLSKAGLDDVAFHIDMTQERAGYDSEVALNALREAYIARARRLGLRILFNTTVFRGNLHEVAALSDFFRDHAADLSLVSFQMQADTGRGVERPRPGDVTQDSVAAQISQGFGIAFPSGVGIGHSDCSRYDHVLIAGNHSVSLLRDRSLIADLFRTFEKTDQNEHAVSVIRPMVMRAFLRRPDLAMRSFYTGLKVLWALRKGLWKARGQAARLSIMIHSFMDADHLEAERCASCVFMVATRDGPMSMCAFNAERDRQLFLPVPLGEGGERKWWSAATGQITKAPVKALPLQAPFKNLKGRKRAEAAVLRKDNSG